MYNVYPIGEMLDRGYICFMGRLQYQQKNISVFGISQLYEDVASNLFFLCSVPCPSHQLMLLQFIIRAISVFSPPIIITLFFHVIKKKEKKMK